MITVLENSLTRKKHTLNLVDHKGKVIGFNPYPGNKKLKYELYRHDGCLILTDEDEPIEKYLIGAPFHFGSDISFTPSNMSNDLTAMHIDLISDKLKLVNELNIVGDGGEYYVEDIGLSQKDLDKLFSKENVNKWMNGEWKYFEQCYDVKKVWQDMTDSEKIESLFGRILKLEEKVNLLGNLK